VIGTDPAFSETPPARKSGFQGCSSPPFGNIRKEEEQIIILPFSQAQRKTNLMNLAIQLWATAL